MDAQSLRCFLRIAELGSFGKAAHALNVTQPTLSRRIALLESELRTKLFVRHQRGVNLTPSGLALVTRALGVARQLDELQEDIKTLDQEPSGSLAIGLPPSLVAVLNGPLVQAYSSKYPRVDLFIYESISDVLGEKLACGDLDVALMFSTRSRLRNVSTKVLAIEEIVLASSPHCSPAKTRLTMSDISKLPLVLYRLPNYIRWRVDIAFQQQNIKPVVRSETNTLPMLLELARRGVGSAILPRSAVEHDVSLNRLMAIPIRGMSVTWTLAVSRNREHSAAVRALIKCIEELVLKQIKAERWKATLQTNSTWQI
ncbi:LysR family transcriptional regulator [Tardiphaga sp. vice304]|uniref:LysR family transcriptional regulator n=1 Tax=Tardiphaga sp. vice304 TaxID=2592817 RepID=UPI0011631E8C|nr:LysR family transcriptional regulator [Tardiphaga sp. vice304]QDM25944.1 LysR family transcriptional regulator [Tardiphaga sp. vice304]